MGIFSSNKQSSSKPAAPVPLDSYTIRHYSSFPTTRVVLSNYSSNKQPLLSVVQHTWRSPTIGIYEGTAGLESNSQNAAKILAGIDITSFGGGGNGHVRDQQLLIQSSFSGEYYTVQTPNLGELVWERVGMLDPRWQLCNGNGEIIAMATHQEMFSSSFVLELYAPGDKYFTEVIILSSLYVEEMVRRRKRRRRNM